MPNNLTAQTALPRTIPLALVPRGLRRVAAAAYLGISPSHFDKQREAGSIPAPKSLFGVLLYDRLDLDAVFDGVPANDNNSDYWDRACGSENPNM